MSDQKRIYTAGEKEYLSWQERQKKGIPLNPETIEEMKTMIQELNLKSYNWLT